MGVTAISLTGWDNTIEPAETVGFMAQRPGAIMGIHFSEERRGGKRHPNRSWVQEFVRLARRQPVDVVRHMRVDAHMGNRWSLDIAQGKMDVLEQEVDPTVFRRIQLNHLGRAQPEQLLEGAEKRKDFTFVVSRSRASAAFCAGMDALLQTYKGPAKIAYLYDDSWGKGVVPEEWPKVLPHAACGYAGGLGPENLSEQIEKLLALNPDANFWVDMESKLRNEHDIFQIEKAIACYDIAQPYLRTEKSMGFRL